jgi:hypothetical protein
MDLKMDYKNGNPNPNYGPTKKVALFTNARDEPHIKEWAAHHLLIGFDNIIIFDHNSVTPLTNVFQNFDKRVVVIRYDTPPTKYAIKLELMNKAIKMAQLLKVDWFIYLDADEFIILNNAFVGIKHLLNKYNFADSLALNWLMFGSNNLIKEPDGLILGNYTKSDLQLNKHVKTFVRPFEAVKTESPHFYNIRNKNKMFALNKLLNGSIEPYCFNSWNIEYNKAPAFIAHYVYQSEESYLKRKVDRPTDDTGGNRGSMGAHIHELHNGYENMYPKFKYAEAVREFLRRFS